jgi:hypothetical protein
MDSTLEFIKSKIDKNRDDLKVYEVTEKKEDLLDGHEELVITGIDKKYTTIDTFVGDSWVLDNCEGVRLITIKKPRVNSKSAKTFRLVDVTGENEAVIWPWIEDCILASDYNSRLGRFSRAIKVELECNSKVLAKYKKALRLGAYGTTKSLPLREHFKYTAYPQNFKLLSTEYYYKGVDDNYRAKILSLVLPPFEDSGIDETILIQIRLNLDTNEIEYWGLIRVLDKNDGILGFRNMKNVKKLYSTKSDEVTKEDFKAVKNISDYVEDYLISKAKEYVKNPSAMNRDKWVKLIG